LELVAIQLIPALRQIVEALHRWQNHRFAKPGGSLSPDAIQTYARGVKTMLSNLAREHIIPYNPLHEYHPPRGQEKLPTTWTPDQMRQILAQPDLSKPEQLRDFTMMALMYDAKCRVSELIRLTMPNPSLEDHRFTVMGKGSRQLVYFFGSDAARVLARYLAIRPKPAPGVENVFLRWDGQQLQRRRVYARVRHYGQLAGFTGARISPRTFRHSGAREYLRLGGNLEELRLMLNHRDTKSTMIYARLENEDVKRAQARFSPLDATQAVPHGKGQIPD
jgi:integrase/recombinase XerD